MADHGRRKQGTRLLCIGQKRIALIIPIAVIGIAILLFWYTKSLQTHLAETAALNTARQYSDALAEFRDLYTSEVVERVRPLGVQVTHDYRDRDGAIPLPATLSMILGERISGRQRGISARLHSPYPFPWREDTGGLRDDFSKEAWSFLSQNEDKSYYRFEDVGGRPTLRYAVADRMRASCIDCHNTHPDTPKTDWKEGDVRGLLEVAMPLDSAVISSRSPLMGPFIALWVGFAVAVIAVIMLLWNHFRYFNQLETEVKSRTEELTSSKEALQVSMKDLELLRFALDQTAIVSITDAQGNITHANDKFCELSGYPRADLLGQNHRIINSGHHTKEFFSDLWQTITMGKVWSGEVHNLAKDGILYWVDATIVPILDSNGKPERYIAIRHDITERKQLQNELLHAQKMESIGQLAAGIAHEINTPIQYVGDNTRFVRDGIDELLTLVKAYAAQLDPEMKARGWEVRAADIKRLLDEVDLEFLSDEIPKAIEQTLEGADRVAKIVRAMKDFSHPGSEEKMLTDLNKAIENTITICRSRWKYVADLETDFDDGLPMVQCLVGEFNQVILNLIVNAADAIGDIVDNQGGGKGRITVSTRQDVESVEIRVSDTGGGIPEAILQKVFDPFFTTKEVGKGTGQGLTISHDVIVNKHGGTIDLESTPGEGTTFIIRLPIDEQTAEQQMELRDAG